MMPSTRFEQILNKIKNNEDFDDNKLILNGATKRDSAKLIDSDIIKLVSALRNNNKIIHLEMPANIIGEKGMQVLQGYLKEYSNIESLNLNANSIGALTFPILVEGLIENTSIQTLFLSRNSISSTCQHNLAKLIEENRNIKQLDVSNNRIDDQGLKLVADALIKNPMIDELNISNCMITNVGANYLYEILKNNEKITTNIIFKNNRIMDSVRKPLESLINERQKLKQIQVDEKKKKVVKRKKYQKNKTTSKSLSPTNTDQKETKQSKDKKLDFKNKVLNSDSPKKGKEEPSQSLPCTINSKKNQSSQKAHTDDDIEIEYEDEDEKNEMETKKTNITNLDSLPSNSYSFYQRPKEVSIQDQIWSMTKNDSLKDRIAKLIKNYYQPIDCLPPKASRIISLHWGRNYINEAKDLYQKIVSMDLNANSDTILNLLNENRIPINTPNGEMNRILKFINFHLNQRKTSERQSLNL